mmetsp:Transcript_40077/g.78507  ORF Transcript_40077/g.78507 Transcript_40077/m.78507 type:complete len:388 (-) Transcript_40077:195-1358(-)|eukprot:CAMPEP_0173395362 /NCGR_PEP_ID=MMETSP1356-20130122/31797_1 /TAXON_ID=77927 ORGANISM="Hemiselmis virescens, Strain PCC157" /NCGR_SAMPLE_ID=MMETSP1356 /ASSEMBLY_ACC=CAM_ASM_000847 /LENGTH=387 /DNA_ID=CAMNT_0014354059 /DNA_START=1 /DNA_END=1164 /DNA_ORIENTATION=+
MTMMRIGVCAMLVASSLAFNTPTFCPVALRRSAALPAHQRAPAAASRQTGGKAAALRMSSPVMEQTAMENLMRPVLGAEKTEQWTWEGYQIRYASAGTGGSKPPAVLIHGFGSSADTWRNQYEALAAAGHPVYGIDLLGSGGSEKPLGVTYSIDLWSRQVLDFVEQVAGRGKGAVLFGNSIGSLVSCTAASDAERGSKCVEGLVLMNCAAGMNNKFILTDSRTSAVGKAIGGVVFGLLDFLLAQDNFAKWFFERTKTEDNVAQVLRNVYVNTDAVDSDLVQSILRPAGDPNAQKVFVKLLTGDPGRTPDLFMDQIGQPMLLVWGDTDPFTPLEGGYGKYFAEELVEGRPNTELTVVNAGHCPQDDDPEGVNKAVVGWLERLPTLRAA